MGDTVQGLNIRAVPRQERRPPAGTEHQAQSGIEASWPATVHHWPPSDPQGFLPKSPLIGPVTTLHLPRLRRRVGRSERRLDRRP